MKCLKGLAIPPPQRLNNRYFSSGYFESGRSIVEMLGIMAIVGVLSVTGIYGYTQAMNKYHANELLNEAMKRAALVAGQIAGTGNVPNTITDGEDSSKHTYTVGNNGNNQFTLGISNVDGETCELMRQMVGGAIQGITCENDSATFTFNNDLSTGNDPNGGNNSEDGNDGNSTNSDNTDTDPACSEVTCPEGATCGVAGNCVTPAASNGCSNNSDCNEWCASNKGENDYGCYCQISASFSGTGNSCYDNFTGTCATISNTEKTNKYSSSMDLTWWSAKNFCKAISEPMAGIQSTCNGDIGHCPTKPDHYWLSDCFETDCTSDSCGAFCKYNGALVRMYRDISLYALCE